MHDMLLQSKNFAVHVLARHQVGFKLCCHGNPKYLIRNACLNNVDPDQTALIITTSSAVRQGFSFPKMTTNN